MVAVADLAFLFAVCDYKDRSTGTTDKVLGLAVLVVAPLVVAFALGVRTRTW